MFIIQNLTYTHPDRETLFSNIQLNINRHDKIALIGNNGTGKSTLLKIMAGSILPSSGNIIRNSTPYYIPQHFGQFNDLSIAQALRVEDKIQALARILSGEPNESNLEILADDWSVEERCLEALSFWGLRNASLHTSLSHLSGGQKTKVFLAGIQVHHPGLVLMDEPSNHLDAKSRDILYRYLQTTTDTLVIVSHDRVLLNLLEDVCELQKDAIVRYGGNYNFYKSQKTIEQQALQEGIQSKEKALRKAKQTERLAMERQQKLDARGQKRQEKAGLPTISMNTLRNKAEKSTAKTKEVHTEKAGRINQELLQLRKELPGDGKMKIGIDDAQKPLGKLLIHAKNINYHYGEHPLWPAGLNFEIHSGERMAIKGVNGSGKTTLLNIILGTQTVSEGVIERRMPDYIYIDQEYSLIKK